MSINKLKILKFKHQFLKKIDLVKIIKLKNLEWKYGLKSHRNWINENIKTSDLHIFLLNDNNLFGYNLLRKRLYYVERLEKKRNIKKHYFYFDTFIIHPSHRKKGYAKFFLRGINKYILKHDFFSLLLCKKKHVKFYKKLNWKLANSKNLRLIDKKTKLNLMSYNNKKLNLKKLLISIN